MDDEDLKRVADFIRRIETGPEYTAVSYSPTLAADLTALLSRLSEAAERERELVEALSGLVDAIDYRETPEGRRSYAILGTMPVAFHRARALQAKEVGE